ncbi:MAG: pectin acetylesterase-family hydrolase [Polyangiaceae bacterium]
MSGLIAPAPSVSLQRMAFAPTLLVIALGLAAVGCGSDEAVEGEGAVQVGFDDATMQELHEAGVDRYIGKFKPEEVSDYGEGLYGFRFAADEHGPICLWGDPYAFGLQDTGSDNLLIYLQGGGACWSELCSANTKAGDRVPTLGWTDPSTEQNPFYGYNMAHVAYCDGSVFSGDNEIDQGDGTIRYHHGLANLTAAMDVLKERYPEPKRIALVGSSAGGYGTIIGTAAVRMQWPTARLDVINDAGLGLTNPERPETLEKFKSEWKFDQFIPASCETCQEGQFSEMIAWALDRDPSLRVGAFSSYEDAVIGGVFLGMDGEAFKALLLKETGSIHERSPERFNRFYISGSQHTAAIGLYDHEVDGMLLTDWVDEMLVEDPKWPDLLQTED